MGRFHIAIVILSLVLIIGLLFRPQNKREHFNDEMPMQVSDEVYIIAQNPQRSPLDLDIPQSSLVINQSRHKLNLPFEFEVNNPNATVVDMKEMAKELLPQGTDANFVIVK